MKKFFERRDPWGHGMALWVVLTMVFLLPFAWWAVQGIDLENDVEQWLPAGDPEAQVLAWYRKHFSAEDRVFIAWEGSTLDDPRAAALAKRLLGTLDSQGIRRGGLKQISSVVTPQAIIERMQESSHGRISREEAIRRLEGVVIGPGGAPIAISVGFSEAGRADGAGTVAAIRQAAIEAGIPEDELHIGGRYVAGSELNAQVKKTAWNTDYPLSRIHKRSPLLLSAAVSVVLAFIMLRSFRLATLVLVVANYATLLAVAMVPLTNGSMNMVLVVMPTLLGVLTLSAAIHVSNYWKHAAARNLRTAVVESVKMAWQPCLLASVTTAIGLASLTTSTLTPVRDFGMYAAAGCLISLVSVLFVLPALLQFWPGKSPTKRDVDRSAWRRLGNFLADHRRLVTAASIVVMVSCAVGFKWFRTETKVIRYFPDEARVVQDYNYLEENLAGIIPVETIVRFDRRAQGNLNFAERMELVRGIQQKLRSHAGVSGTMSLADFQPLADPPEEKTGLKRILYNRKVTETEKRIREGESDAGAFLAVASQPADLRSHSGPPVLIREGDELWRITAQAAIMTDLDYGRLTRDLNAVAGTALESHAGVDHLVTGMVPFFLRTQEAVLDSLIRSFGLAFAVIGLVMIGLLKHPVSGLLSMLPNLLPIGVVFGLISWSGMAVDVGTMITASVALGIAVDGTLHLLTWFRAGIIEGQSRREAICRALEHCGPAMWQTSAAVGLGLLMLFPADLLLINRFGWLMAALIGVALVADVIFLPALLAGPLGDYIERTVRRGAEAEVHEAVQVGHSQPQPHLLHLSSSVNAMPAE